MYQKSVMIKICLPAQKGGWPKKMVLVTKKKSFSYRGLTAKNSDSLAVIENMASSGDLHTHNPW